MSEIRSDNIFQQIPPSVQASGGTATATEAPPAEVSSAQGSAPSAPSPYGTTMPGISPGTPMSDIAHASGLGDGNAANMTWQGLGGRSLPPVNYMHTASSPTLGHGVVNDSGHQAFDGPATFAASQGVGPVGSLPPDSKPAVPEKPVVPGAPSAPGTPSALSQSVLNDLNKLTKEQIGGTLPPGLLTSDGKIDSTKLASELGKLSDNGSIKDTSGKDLLVKVDKDNVYHRAKEGTDHFHKVGDQKPDTKYTLEKAADGKYIAKPANPEKPRGDSFDDKKENEGGRGSGRGSDEGGGPKGGGGGCGPRGCGGGAGGPKGGGGGSPSRGGPDGKEGGPSRGGPDGKDGGPSRGEGPKPGDPKAAEKEKEDAKLKEFGEKLGTHFKNDQKFVNDNKGPEANKLFDNNGNIKQDHLKAINGLSNGKSQTIAGVKFAKFGDASYYQKDGKWYKVGDKDGKEYTLDIDEKSGDVKNAAEKKADSAKPEPEKKNEPPVLVP